MVYVTVFHKLCSIPSIEYEVSGRFPHTAAVKVIFNFQ